MVEADDDIFFLYRLILSLEWKRRPIPMMSRSITSGKNASDAIMIDSSSSSGRSSISRGLNTTDIGGTSTARAGTDVHSVGVTIGSSQGNTTTPASQATTNKKRELPWKKKRTNKAKKPKKPPQFAISEQDPFEICDDAITFCIRGKPLPQSRDRMGWNGTRYNPSKRSQNGFGNVVMEACRTRASNDVLVSGTLFGDCKVEATVSFFFPTPKTTGKLQNTADIDNLLKFVFDALNGVLYNDDGQVVRVVAEKSFCGARGGNGYTCVTIKSIK